MSGKATYYENKYKARDEQIIQLFTSIMSKDNVAVEDMFRGLIAAIRWYELTTGSSTMVSVICRVRDELDAMWRQSVDGELIERYCPSALALLPKDHRVVAMDASNMIFGDDLKALQTMFTKTFAQAVVNHSATGVRRFMREAFLMCALEPVDGRILCDFARAWKFVETERKIQHETECVEKALEKIDKHVEDMRVLFPNADLYDHRIQALAMLENQYRTNKTTYAELIVSEMISFETEGVRKRFRE